MDTIKLKGYEIEYDPQMRVEHYYAIPIKGARIEMPRAFRDMYDNDHLAIMRIESIDMPELLEVEPPYYQPMRTVL